MRDLFFIGALDYPNVAQAGDAVKNRYLLSFFQSKLQRVDYVDTQRWKKNPLIIKAVDLIRLEQMLKISPQEERGRK